MGIGSLELFQKRYDNSLSSASITRRIKGTIAVKFSTTTVDCAMSTFHFYAYISCIRLDMTFQNSEVFLGRRLRDR